MSEVVSTLQCYECGATMEGRKGEYKYTECGLTSVRLKDILVYHCQNCNALVPEIPAVGVLHRVIALRIVNKKNLLTGSEIRFLRKLCGYSVNDFAAILGSSKSVISRFEKEGCGKENDRLIRYLLIAKFSRELAGQSPLILRNVTIEQINIDIENTLKLMEGRGQKDEQYDISPEDLALYVGSTDAPSEPEMAVQ
jgi:YgiT-type zinc finger domain-containing protein